MTSETNKINADDKTIREVLDKVKYKIDMSRGMLYRALVELKDIDLINK